MLFAFVVRFKAHPIALAWVGSLHPENAVIPIQTDKDREILPKFVVTGVRQIDDDFLALLISELEKGHMTRNGELK